MDDKILEKLSLSKIELVSLNVFQKDIEKKGSKRFIAKLKIEPEVQEDSEKWLVYNCVVNLTFGEDGPFAFNIKLKARFKKNQHIDWQEAYVSFNVINKIILAEASRLIANMCSAMKIPPIVLSSSEMIDLAKASTEKGDEDE